MPSSIEPSCYVHVVPDGSIMCPSGGIIDGINWVFIILTVSCFVCDRFMTRNRFTLEQTMISNHFSQRNASILI